jgi:hypothetical protein
VALIPSEPSERLRLIQALVKQPGGFYFTEHADQGWRKSGYAPEELPEWVSKLRIEDCIACEPSKTEGYEHETVDIYLIDTGRRKGNRKRAIRMELVLCEDWVKVVSAHHHTVKKRDEM